MSETNAILYITFKYVFFVKGVDALFWKEPDPKYLSSVTHVVSRGSSPCCPYTSQHVCSAMPDPKDCGPPGPSVHGVSQAGTLEWVAMPSSRQHS